MQFLSEQWTDANWEFWRLLRQVSDESEQSQPPFVKLKCPLSFAMNFVSERFEIDIKKKTALIAFDR